MKVSIASDHRGYPAKENIKRILVQMGHEVQDFGTDSDHSADYPDFVPPVCEAVRSGEADRGMLLCGSGIGMCMTANKIGGIRAALCHDELTAQMSRRHNDANVLCMGGDLLGEGIMRRIVEIWMSTDFEGGRHERRVKKMMRIGAMSPEELAAASKPPVKAAKAHRAHKKN